MNSSGPFKNILVATDFGNASRRAAELGCELARQFGARLTLLHVWTVPIPAYAEAISIRLDEIEKEAVKAMEEEVDRLRDKCPTPIRTLLVVGLAWRTIVDAIEEHKCDLVIVGTHGRHGVERLFLGSVAEKVVRASPVPVLTVRAPA